MAHNKLQGIINDGERRLQRKNLSVRLRDASDPFQLPEETFRKLYRLSREVAFEVFKEIEPFLENSQRITKIPKVVKFVTTMHFFAHGSYQKSVGKDHYCSLSQPSVSRCMHQIVNAMNKKFVQRYIQFPNNLQAIDRVKAEFLEEFDFPGVVGCIDYTHVAIATPPANDPIQPAHVFMNPKGFHSINCQIICDADLKILAINARYPGSVHATEIWMVSNINKFLRENYTTNNDRTTWLLGDSGYPLQPFLLTPIMGADANTADGKYAHMHSRVRNCIKNCIGVLKAYFRCLCRDKVLHYRPAVAAKIVYCCAALHNIMRLRNITDPLINIEYEENEINEIIEDGELSDQGDFLAEGFAIRNNLIQTVFA